MIIKLISWNVNGLRAVQKKGFWDFAKSIKADVIAIQETKTDAEKIIAEKEIVKKQGFDFHFSSAEVRKGYSGVANLSKASSSLESFDSLFETTVNDAESNLELLDYQIGLQNPKFDEEGRLVVTKYKVKNSDLKFTLINGYYPQGGRGPHRIEDKIEF